MPVLTRTVYYTAKEYADYLKVGRSMITKLCNQGMPHRKIGNKLTIPFDKAEEWIDKKFNY